MPSPSAFTRTITTFGVDMAVLGARRDIGRALGGRRSRSVVPSTMEYGNGTDSDSFAVEPSKVKCQLSMDNIE
eukprot:scaffold198238_cov39-Tisochrysis_lutea.AAC.2